MIQRRDLARRIAPLVSLTIPQALTVVDTCFDEVAKALAEGTDAAVFGFGEFTTKVIPEHEAVNLSRSQSDDLRIFFQPSRVRDLGSSGPSNASRSSDAILLAANWYLIT